MNYFIVLFCGAAVAMPLVAARADVKYFDKDGKEIDVSKVGPFSTGIYNGSGAQKLISVKDPAGDTFTLNINSDAAFEGSVFVKATGKTQPFGLCKYAGGQNIIKDEFDKNNNIFDIEWLNVQPKGDMTSKDPKVMAAVEASKAAINSNLGTKRDEATGDWRIRTGDWLNKNGFKPDVDYFNYTIAIPQARQPSGVLAESAQQLGYVDSAGSFVVKETLTADQALLDYPDPVTFATPLPDLQIDTIMLTPEFVEPQDVYVVPEPGSLTHLIVGTIGAMGYIWRRRGGKGSSTFSGPRLGR